MADYYTRDTCRLCEGAELTTVIELTPTPPGNRVLSPSEAKEAMPVYPLEVRFCRSCAHLQLGHVVDPKILYQRRYSYVSATSPVFVAHLRDYARQVVDRFSLEPNGLVVDIGSNDGTCLGFFKDAGFEVLGVDPATDIAHEATAGGIETVADFFGLKLAKRLRDERGAAHLITSHNTCAHIDDLADVLDGVNHWLRDDGLFVMEVGYFVDVYQNAWFDTIYHEHLDYHTVTPLPRFFSRFGLEIVGVERTAPQGGSIRLTAQRQGGPHEPDGSLTELLDLERSLAIDRPETFQAFGKRVNSVRDELTRLLISLKSEGKTIAAYGAPTKATTLLMHFGLGREELDFTLEDNPLKHGCLVPGALIPILPSAELYERKPDYLVILAWNFAKPIMKKHTRYHFEGGRFILPMPVPMIVEDLDKDLLNTQAEGTR